MNLNVNALSTAIAVALQQAAQMSPQVRDQPGLPGSISLSQQSVSQRITSRGLSGEGEGSRSSSSHDSAAGGSGQEIVTLGTELNPRIRRSASIILLSHLKRRRSENNAAVKKAKITIWDRDIICLPSSCANGNHICFPRGKYRAILGRVGLLGKVRLQSDMTASEVLDEIRSVFVVQMGGRRDFPFEYLQRTGCGSYSLMIPNVSSLFDWTPQQVAKLSNAKGSIFILARDKLTVDDEIAIDLDESEEQLEEQLKEQLEEQEEQLEEQNQSNVTSGVSNSEESYRKFVKLMSFPTPIISSDDVEDSDDDFFYGLDKPEISLNPVLKPPGICHAADSEKTKSIIVLHQKKVLAEDDFQKISVRRSHLISDTFEQFNNKSFDCSLLLKIFFVGESAEDIGGPKREFFRLLIQQMFQLEEMFAGWPSNVTMRHNIEATAANRFFLAGKILSTVLIQGGQAPLCFSEAVADYIVYDKVCSLPVIEEVSDAFARDCLTKINMTKTNDELEHLVACDEITEFIMKCGLNPSNYTTLRKKTELLNAIWLHFVFFGVHAELQQFRKGFRETLQMEVLLSQYPAEVRALLVPSNYKMTARCLLDLFTINYSASENKRCLEDQIVAHWRRYIVGLETEGGKVTLSDVMNFFCGTNNIQAISLEELVPMIDFMEADLLPTASTCGLTITFPRNFAEMQFDQFRDKMDMCVLGSQGFGSI